jgi:hypothetical protein
MSGYFIQIYQKLNKKDSTFVIDGIFFWSGCGDSKN